MKWIAIAVMFTIPLGCSSKNPGSMSDDHQHSSDTGHAKHSMGEAAVELVIQTVPTAPKAGQPTQLKLMIHGPGGNMVKDFEMIHEKLVHLIIVREGLDQFAHIHPAVDSSGNIAVTFSFPLGGKYRIFADYKPAGKTAATATGVANVSGDAPRAPEPKPDVPGKVAGDGLNAEIAVDNAKPGGETKIAFMLADPTGKPAADLQPNLGAMGHLVIIGADGTEYVHAHPAEKKLVAGQVAFEAHFRKPGIYKGWGQFQRAGVVHTVPFVIRVY